MGLVSAGHGCLLSVSLVSATLMIRVNLEHDNCLEQFSKARILIGSLLKLGYKPMNKFKYAYLVALLFSVIIAQAAETPTPTVQSPEVATAVEEAVEAAVVESDAAIEAETAEIVAEQEAAIEAEAMEAVVEEEAAVEAEAVEAVVEEEAAVEAEAMEAVVEEEAVIEVEAAEVVAEKEAAIEAEAAEVIVDETVAAEVEEAVIETEVVD